MPVDRRSVRPTLYNRDTGQPTVADNANGYTPVDRKTEVLYTRQYSRDTGQPIWQNCLALNRPMYLVYNRETRQPTVYNRDTNQPIYCATDMAKAA